MPLDRRLRIGEGQPLAEPNLEPLRLTYPLGLWYIVCLHLSNLFHH